MSDVVEGYKRALDRLGRQNNNLRYQLHRALDLLEEHGIIINAAEAALYDFNTTTGKFYAEEEGYAVNVRAGQQSEDGADPGEARRGEAQAS